MRIAHGGADVGVALARSHVAQGAVHRLAGRRARGGPRVRLAREGGDGRARRQGRDARARRRAPAARGRRARCGRAAPAPGRRAARSSASTWRARSTSASSTGSCAGARRADASATRPTRACRSGRSPRARRRRARRGARAGGGRRRARGCTAAGPVDPPGCAGGRLLRARGDHRRDARRCGCMREPIDGPVLVVVRGRLGRRGDRAGQRQRLRPRRVGVDGRPLPGRSASRASCARGWCGSTTTCPGRWSRAGPGARRPARGSGARSARRGCGACAQEKLITWDPPRTRGLWWGALRRDHREGRARGREDALGARGRPRPRLARGRARAHAARRARVRARPARRASRPSACALCGYA